MVRELQQPHDIACVVILSDDELQFFHFGELCRSTKLLKLNGEGRVSLVIGVPRLSVLALRVRVYDSLLIREQYNR